MEEPPFFLPDGLRFHCLRCGDCCRGWTVLVDDATQDALARVDWAKHSPELSGKKLFEKKKHAGGLPWVVAQLPDGSCVFLKEGECLIHNVLGYASKDLTCRQYPAKFSKTPAGVYVGFSFACASVRRNEGESVADSEADYRRLYAEASRRLPTKPSRIMLDKVAAFDWGAYQAFESALSAMLGSPEKSMPEILCACNSFTASLKAAFPGTATLSEEGVKSFVGEEGASRFYAPVPSSRHFPKRQRVVLAFSVMSHREKNSLIKTLVNPFVSYMRLVSGKGRVNVAGVGEVNIEELGAVSCDLEESRARELITRYFSHFLFRKSLLAPPSVADNLKLLVIGYALIRFYALCLARSRGSLKADYEDVYKAVGCVDRYFLLHATQSKTLLSDKRTEFLLRTFLDDPEFVPTMLCEKPFTPPA